MGLAVETASTDNVSAPAANTAAVVNYPAEADKIHLLQRIDWSYGDPADNTANPTAGSVKVENGAGTVVFGPMHIVKSGPGWHDFGDRPLKMSENTACIVTLAAGGGSIEGVLTCQKYTVDSSTDGSGLV